MSRATSRPLNAPGNGLAGGFSATNQQTAALGLAQAVERTTMHTWENAT
ncbi:MAG TPA: hypothetical protein VGF67_05395 [Ktedonobacteraceae bacterium]